MATNTEATVIYDSVSWAEEVGKLPDGRPNMLIHTASRGEDISLPQAEFDRLSDKSAHAPFGAVAPAGSDLANKLSRPISGAEDPAAVHARLAAIQVEGPAVAVLRDPSGRPSHWEVTEVDPGVERSRSAPASASAAASGSQLPAAALDALDKGSLTKMAKALGVEVGSKDTADEIKAALQAHVSGAGSGADGETGGEFASGGPSAAGADDGSGDSGSDDDS